MVSAVGFKNFRTKVLFSFVAVYLISWLSVLVATFFNLQEQRETERDEIRQQFTQIFQRELTNYRNAFSASLTLLTHPSRIAHSFTLKNKPFFQSNFSVDYANLNQRLSVSHFYFSTADRENIIRMHAPGRNGDIINRPTTLVAEQSGEVSSGVELGRLGSLTFRVVKPLYNGQKLRGFVELGRELDKIWEIAAHQLNVSILVNVNKGLLNRADWTEGKGIFGYAANWNDNEEFVEVGSVVNNGKMRHALTIVAQQQRNTPAGQVTLDGDVYLYNTLPLTDFSGEQIGTIITSYPREQLTGDLLTDLAGAASASAVALLIGLTMAYIILSPAVRSMQSRQAELKSEIASRTHDLSVAKEEAVTARDEAEIANKAKSEFLSNMSHELRTPLNAIIGFSSIVKDDELAEGIGEKYSGYAEDIHSSGTHLLDIINDILDVSRIEAGEMEMRFQELSVDKLMHECHQMVNVRATGRFVPVIHDKYGEDIWMDADATRLKQIILNLLTNAIKFTEAPGIVRFRAEQPTPDKVSFIIEDEGIGVPEKEIETVLRRFGKAASSALAKQREEGTGLGLTLVQDLVKQHGGEFVFESTVGKGTKVIVTLPLYQHEAHTPDLI